MIFTEEELELELSSFINPELKNQDLVNRIHLMFGGEFFEKTRYYYNHVAFSFNGNLMLFVYDTHAHGDFVYKSPHGSAENVNGWKLKKLIECITNVFKEEKEKELSRKLAKIEGDF